MKKASASTVGRLGSVLLALCMAPAAFADDTNYTYDTLGRLTLVSYTCGKSIAYSYDAAGNRTQVVTTGGANSAPVANGDTVTVTFNTAKTFDPRTNDTDVDCGDTLTITAIGAGADAPQHGGAVINGGVSITYTPTTGYSGSDSFKYTINDGNGHQATATVTLTIQAGTNQNPVAVNDTVSTPLNTATTFDPRANDSDPNGDALTITAIGGGADAPQHGGAVINGGVSITYTPTTGYSGSDSFKYTVGDGNGGSAIATVSVTVTGGTNHAPVANDDSFAFTAPPNFRVLNPRTNDTDADGDTLSITQVSVPSHGTATIGGGGTSVTYNAGAAWQGVATFNYTISDGHGGTATATVTVTVDRDGGGLD